MVLPCGGGDEGVFWHSVLDALTAHVAILDAEGRILAVNAAWRRFASENGQVDPDDCIGVNYLAVCDRAFECEDGAEAIAAAAGIRAVLNGEREEFSVSYPCHGPKTKRWFMFRVTRFPSPGPARVVVAHENITAPKAAQLRASEAVRALERSRALESASSRILEWIARDELTDGILVEIALMVQRQRPGLDCAVVRLKDGSSEMFAPPGFPPPLLARLRAATFPSAEHGPELSLANLAQAVEGESASAADWPIETLPVRTRDGAVAGWIAMAGAGADDDSVIAAAARAASLVAIALDRADLHHRLSFQAGHDPITELPNRLRFQERVELAAGQPRNESRMFAVGLLDLYRFGQVNDAYGHSAGDMVLRQIGRRIADCLRPGDCVARVCGDQFAILLDNLRDEREGEAIVDRIQAAIAAPISVADQTVTVSVTSGWCVFPDDGDDASALLRNADTALSWARQYATGTPRRYRDTMGVKAAQRLKIQRNLPAALDRQEFDLHYQLQFDPARRVCGMEALVRWERGPCRGVPADRFIPIAEEYGLVRDIGRFVLREACGQRAAWRDLAISDARVAVNVSPLQLADSGFTDLIAATLAETGLDPRMLELEVTETVMMMGVGRIVPELERLREIGVTVALDDFGTGYSSLSYLRTLPVDTVKIDRSFVRELDGGDTSGLAMLRAIISLAHSLGLSVVAEGVETKRQADALAALGCDVLQGFLFHRPAPAPSVTRILQSSGSAAVSLPQR